MFSSLEDGPGLVFDAVTDSSDSVKIFYKIQVPAGGQVEIYSISGTLKNAESTEAIFSHEGYIEESDEVGIVPVQSSPQIHQLYLTLSN